VGSMFKEAGDIGKKLLGSPAFAIPLKAKDFSHFSYYLVLRSSKTCVKRKGKNVKIQRKEKKAWPIKINYLSLV